MSEVACLLLAAGCSRRMLGENKLLVELGGCTILRRVAEEACRAPFSIVVLVTGHEQNAITEQVLGLPIVLAHNENYERGMHSSIRAGLLALGSSAKFFAVCLADQPFLTAEDYGILIDQAERSPDAMM